MLNAMLAGLLLLQAAPATPPPAAPAAPAPAAPTPIEDVRFCIAATETAAAMMRAQGGQAAMQAAFMEGAVTTLQAERTQLGDTDNAALDAERTRIRTAVEAAGGGLEGMQGERDRFMSACMPRLRAAFGG